MKRIFYFLSFLLLLTSCSGKKDNKTISIGYINWDDGIALTHLVEVILEQQGYRVILKNADPAPIYATMARGKVDLLMDAWLPATQADYMKQYGKNLEILGEIYRNARIGLVRYWLPFYESKVSVCCIKNLSFQTPGSAAERGDASRA